MTVTLGLGRRRAALLAIILVVLVGVAEGTAREAQAGDWVDIVVAFEEPLTGERATGSSLDRIGVLIDRVRSDRVDQAMRRWRDHPDVRDVRHPVAIRKADVPNDPSWPLQWESHQVEVDVAWETTLGDLEVIIAVLDTGLDPTVPDLQGKIAPGGWNYVDNSADTSDDDPGRHGTQAAMVAVSAVNDASHNAGFCPACSVLPMKVLDNFGGGLDAPLAAAIVDSVDLGANVINMSLGGPDSTPVLENAVAYAAANGVLMIGAAGNANTTTPFYPAAFPEVVGVAGIELPDFGAGGPYPMAGDEHKASSSNYGSWVSVSGPWCNVTFFVPPGDAALFCGTSSAAPMVAGAAGLLLSHRPWMTAPQARAMLEFTALDVVPTVGGTVVAEHGRVSPPGLLASPFIDVGTQHPFFSEISWMADEAISTGFPDATFRPAAGVTRQAMSAFMARLAGAELDPCTQAPFPDVSADHPFCAEIAWMADQEITTGFQDGTFRPSAGVTRQAMSAFMFRLAPLLDVGTG